MVTGEGDESGAIRKPTLREIRRGAVALLPLWLGIIPFAVAYALLARTSGLSPAQTVALSLFVFAGSAQLAFVRLAQENAGIFSLLLTVLLLNLRHVLYALSTDRHLPRRPRPPRPVLAYFLTDEAYGISIRAFMDGKGSAGFLFGAGMSLFVCFNLATLGGTLLGGVLPDTGRLGLEMVFPLSFLALLLPLLRSRLDVAVALGAGAAAVALSRVTSGGVTVLATTIAGGSIGAFLMGRRSPG